MWEPTPRFPSIPRLPKPLQEQLLAIAPSTEFDFKYYPCSVFLRDGTKVDRAYVSPELSYLRHWGDDRNRPEVNISDVVSIEEFPHRLPVRFANELYAAGESAMGGCFFVLIFKSGHKQAYVTGNALDFLPYPAGLGPTDVVAVEPHVGRHAPSQLSGLNYHWCLYGE